MNDLIFYVHFIIVVQNFILIIFGILEIKDRQKSNAYNFKTDRPLNAI
jgi:hypothetical protein